MGCQGRKWNPGRLDRRNRIVFARLKSLDGLRVRGKALSIFYYREPEKHLSSPSAVDTLLDDAVSEGVLYFRTPSGRTLTRTL